MDTAKKWYGLVPLLNFPEDFSGIILEDTSSDTDFLNISLYDTGRVIKSVPVLLSDLEFSLFSLGDEVLPEENNSLLEKIRLYCRGKINIDSSMTIFITDNCQDTLIAEVGGSISFHNKHLYDAPDPIPDDFPDYFSDNFPDEFEDTFPDEF